MTYTVRSAIALCALVATVTASGMAFRGAGAAEPSAQLVEHAGLWESGYGVEFYNVVGKVRNTSARPVAYVKLRVDALDVAGKVVGSIDAYNASAESMSAPGAKLDELTAAGKVKPLGADATDPFRASFLKEDTPTLMDYRVTVVESPPVQ
jgi:hypothetical protein